MQKATQSASVMGVFILGVAVAYSGALSSWTQNILFGALVLSLAVALVRREYFSPILIGAFLLGGIRFHAGAFSFEFLKTVTSPLEKITGNFIHTIERLLPEPHASYLGGILVGARSSIPYDLKRDFIKTGTMHITALSGYNVSIIAKYLHLIFRSVAWSLFGIVLFVLATGASSSVVRAALMGSLLVVTAKAGRQYSALHALLAAAFCMIFFSPKILFEDIGFQLSVAATAGIILLPPYLERGLWWMSEKFQIRESFLVTLSAQIATLPIVLYYFHTFSLISPLVNLLVLPTIPWVMLFGALVGVCGFLSIFLGSLIAWPAYLLLSYQIFVIQFFAQLVS